MLIFLKHSGGNFGRGVKNFLSNFKVILENFWLTIVNLGVVVEKKFGVRTRAERQQKTTSLTISSVAVTVEDFVIRGETTPLRYVTRIRLTLSFDYQFVAVLRSTAIEWACVVSRSRSSSSYVLLYFNIFRVIPFTTIDVILANKE